MSAPFKHAVLLQAWNNFESQFSMCAEGVCVFMCSAAHGSLDTSDTCQRHTDELAVAGTLSLASGTGSSDSASNPTVDKATTVICSMPSALP